MKNKWPLSSTNAIIVTLGLIWLLATSCTKEKLQPVSFSVLDLGEQCSLRDIEFVDDTLGFLCGGTPGEYGVIWRTQDRGFTWTRVFQSSSHCIYDAAFYDMRNGYAGGDRLLLLRTSDGGQSWSDVFENTSFSNWTDFIKPIRKILYPSPSTLIAAGGDDWDKGLMCVSHNWGSNWFFRDFPNQLNDLALVGTPGVWSCGYGIAMYSADSCITNSIRTPGEENFTGIDFLDAATGLACGYNGGIFHTTDGGLNWVQVRKSNGTFSRRTHLNDVRFIDEQHALAVGSEGLILYSTDGGLQWMQLATEFDNDLLSVAVKPDLWICGSQGFLAKISL